MSKKTQKKKMILGNRLKQNRRMPVLAMVRTHRRVNYNKLQRGWRSRKLKIDA